MLGLSYHQRELDRTNRGPNQWLTGVPGQVHKEANETTDIYTKGTSTLGRRDGDDQMESGKKEATIHEKVDVKER